MKREPVGVVLAGGKSSRMGRNKALLQGERHDFLQETIQKFEGITGQVVISAAPDMDYSAYGVPVIRDRDAHQGALGGIEAVLAAIEAESFFFLAVDLPGIPPALIRGMIGAAGDADALVPLNQGYHEPLCALYRRRCLPAIRESLAEGRRAVTSFYPRICLAVFPEDAIRAYGDPRVLFHNVNRKEDYHRYQEMRKP